MNDNKTIRMTLREFREMLQEILDDDIPAAPITGESGKCNCENSTCSHGFGECSNQAGRTMAQYVGALCDDCAEMMPKQYHLARKNDRRTLPGSGSKRPGDRNSPMPPTPPWAKFYKHQP